MQPSRALRTQILDHLQKSRANAEKHECKSEIAAGTRFAIDSVVMSPIHAAKNQY